MWAPTLVGLLMAVGCMHASTTVVEHGNLHMRAEELQGPARYARDLADCQTQIAHELAAERPVMSPRVAAFGPIGAAMDADINRHKAVAKLQICMELRDYVVEPKPSPSPARYILTLLTCVQSVQESLAPDATRVRSCMEARGYQVPW